MAGGTRPVNSAGQENALSLGAGGNISIVAYRSTDFGPEILIKLIWCWKEQSFNYLYAVAEEEICASFGS